LIGRAGPTSLNRAKTLPSQFSFDSTSTITGLFLDSLWPSHILSHEWARNTKGSADDPPSPSLFTPSYPPSAISSSLL
jgi:hypothetical protein